MPFIRLNQKVYKDSNGQDILASVVGAIAPYVHVIDGFYKWECGKCFEEHGSRACGWPIAGQVLLCEKCNTHNLLVKTNTIELDQAFGAKLTLERETADLRRDQENFQAMVKSSASQKFVHLIPMFENILKDLKAAQDSTK